MAQPIALPPPDMSSSENNPTRRSLLSRLKNWDDQESWRDFFETYWKLIYQVAIKAGLPDAEAQDVVQETILAVARAMPDFKYDRTLGSFKNWLLVITRRRITDYLRKQRRQVEVVAPAADPDGRTDLVERVADPSGGDLDAIWEQEWEEKLTAMAIARVKKQVEPRQFQVFNCYVVKQWPVNDVVKALGVTAGQVYLAKHRISAAIRTEIEFLKTQRI